MSTVVSDIELVGANTVPEESSKGATSWGAVVAGGVGAAALTVVLMLVGSGLGLSMVSPYVGIPTLQAATVWTAVWLVVTQWLSALLGGYLAGRLRTKWVNLHTDEVFFRDTAHGFLAWALATLLAAGLLRDFEQVRIDFINRVRSEEPDESVERWVDRNPKRIAQFRALVDRAKLVGSVSPAMLAQIASQARILLSR